MRGGARPLDARRGPRPSALRRAVLLAALAALAALALAAPAGAHPLGNFSINHLDVVRVGAERVDVRYILDQAEIPTFQERGLAPAQVLARKRAVVGRGVSLTVGGRSVTLRLAPGGRVTFPQGQGGLRTTRVELALSARVRARGAVIVRDATYRGRVGWRAVVVRPASGTAVRSDVTSDDPTRGLRVYPTALVSSPANRAVATLTVRSGDGTVTAPRLDAPGTQTTRGHSAGDGLAGIFSDAAAGQGVLLFLLFAAFGWGAVHALSPGHGKAMVAAYLVGTRGTARHAIGLGLAVTVTHTIGVFALGVVTLALSAYVLPEDLYPWLNLASGLLVLGVGGAVLRGRVRRARSGHAHSHGHAHGPHGHVDGPHSHVHGPHSHVHGPHSHVRGPHSHARPHTPEHITTRGLLAMGASAGLIPCPSALVVLLGAIAQHEVALGLLLILAFSAGLAATLTALGIAVVHAGRLTARIAPDGRLVAVLPAVSALVIVGVGTVLTVEALHRVMA
jgi:nickel/cobalt transporter (NicO) family protein